MSRNPTLGTPAQLPTNPVDWALNVADVFSFGLSSQLLRPFRSLLAQAPLQALNPFQVLERALGGSVPWSLGDAITITATPEQIKTIDAMPNVGPVYALNLLRFKPHGGAEKFNAYVQASLKGVERIGGRLIFNGQGLATAIGPNHWDDAGLLEYPSLRAFSQYFFHDPEMQRLEQIRADALLDSRLYLFTPVKG